MISPLLGLRIALLLCASALLLTLVGAQLPATSALPSRQGPAVQAYPLPFLGINLTVDQATPAARQTALASLEQSGFGWVRLRLAWDELEPAPGHYRWAASDALLDAIRPTGLVPVVVLDGTPAWARAPQDQAPTPNAFAPPADVEHFARFAAAFAQRYGGQLRFYQLWDEPNIAPHWGNRLVEPVGYAQLLKRAATAIRAADPDAVIVLAALAPTVDRGHTAIDERYYLQRLYAAGAAPYFDVVAIQPFGFGYAPDAPPNPRRLNFARAQLIRQTMVAAGDGATPIWGVRYGWNRQGDTAWAAVSTAQQQAFAAKALTLAQEQWPWLTAMAWAADQPTPGWEGLALTPALAEALRGAANPLQPVTSPPGLRSVAEREKLLTPLRHGKGPGVRWQAILPRNSDGWSWLGLLLVVVGRLVMLGQRLPWRAWRVRYREWPWWGQVGLWVGLAIVYYLATWPPLILLCWATAVIVLRWHPQVGLWLAAALIPFHAQHKEFTLGAFTLAVAPSHALLLCLGLAKSVAIYNDRPAMMSIKKSTSAIFGAGGPTLSLPKEGIAVPSLGRGRVGLVWLYRTIFFIPISNTAFFALSWLLLNLLTMTNVWHWPAYGEGLWDLVLLPLLGCWLVTHLITSRQEAERLEWALLTGGLLVAIGGLWLWLRGEGTNADGVLRLVGPYFSPNGAALYLERALFVGVGLLFTSGRWVRPWLLGALLLVLLALALTASRGAMLLALPAGLLFLSWRLGRGTTKQIRWYALAVILIGITGLSLAGPALMARLTNSATITQRLITWEAALHLWRDFPFFGVGPGGFFWRYPAYLPLGALDEPNLYHPHQLWLEMATGWGAVGLLWLGWVLWWVGRMVWQGRVGLSTRGGEVGWLAALVTGLAHAQVDAFFNAPDLALWLWLGLALLGKGEVE